METCLIAVTLEPCIQITCYTIVRKGIGTVCCDVNLNEPVALKVVIFCCWCSNLCVCRKNDDTVVACANANLVLCAYHTVALNTAKLRLLYDKFLVAVVELATEVGNDNLLSGCHVRSTADNL